MPKWLDETVEQQGQQAAQLVAAMTDEKDDWGILVQSMATGPDISRSA